MLKGQKLKDFKEQFGYFITKADDPEQTETDFPLLSETLDNQAKSRLKANEIKKAPWELKTQGAETEKKQDAPLRYYTDGKLRRRSEIRA